MKHLRAIFLPLMAGLTISIAPMAKAETYSYSDLVDKLTDLQQLAVPPAPGERTALASSYDRRSRYDAGSDKYVDWNADADGDGVVRMEGSEAVLADIQGAGCIFRIWAATAGEGHVKIFLDGSETPAVDLPFIGYFNGQSEPFTQSALVYKTTDGNNGYNNYTPISFQKSCKIVADPDWGRYYQITYHQFASGSVVPTFSRVLSPENVAALVRANATLSHPSDTPVSQPGQVTEKKDLTVETGKSTVVFDQGGEGAITSLRVKFDLPGDIETQRTFLRQLALSITWDGQAQPSVWSPWGDFFGDSSGATPLHSLPTGLGDDGYWYSNWYMPFASHATIAVENDSPAPTAMSWEITRAPLSQPAESLLRFHAKWHRDAFLPDRPDRQIDWPLLKTQGTGRYVGTQLHVWNPRGGWWGEGDDKFFVDGEKFPSSFGTGSEDYFGGGWGMGSLFDRAFHGLSALAPFNRGHVSAHRWHIADNVPFQTSFEGDIEKYYTNESPTFTKFAAVAFWYLDSRGTDPYPIVPVDDRIGYWVAPPIYREPGVIEGEDLSILKQQPKDSAQTFDAIFLSIPPQVISNDHVLFWRMQDLGQQLVLGFKIAKEGNYRIVARILHRNDGGIFQFGVNGQNLGAPVDFYGPPQGDQVESTQFSGGALSFATPVDPIDLGVCHLVAGDNTLTATLVAENKALSKDGDNIDFYLDYIKLIPVP